MVLVVVGAMGRGEKRGEVVGKSALGRSDAERGTAREILWEISSS